MDNNLWEWFQWVFVDIWNKDQVIKGRDEKGCKMDGDRRRHVNQVEKCRMVDVGQEKCSAVDFDCRPSKFCWRQP